MSSAAASPAPPSAPSTIALNAATMMAPPSWRKKLSVPVAVPNWCGRTTFWITTVVTGYIGPSPRPAASKSAQTPASETPAGSTASTTSAAMLTSMPASGTRMYFSMRAISRPAISEPTVVPATKAISARLDWLAVRPSTSPR